MPKRERVVAVIKYSPGDVNCKLEVPKALASAKNSFLQGLRDKLKCHDLFHLDDKSYKALFGGTKTDVKRLYKQSLKTETNRTFDPEKQAVFDAQRNRMIAAAARGEQLPRKDLQGVVINGINVMNYIKEKDIVMNTKFHQALNEAKKQGEKTFQARLRDIVTGRLGVSRSKLSKRTQRLRQIRKEKRELMRKGPVNMEQRRQLQARARDTPMPQSQNSHKIANFEEYDSD